MKVKLRRGESEDAALIRGLTRDAYAKWVPVIGREPLPMGADYDAALKKHRFDLIYGDDVLAGLIETADEGDTLLIVNMAVAPAMQKKGFGKALIAFADALARQRGCKRVRLYTNKLMASNIALYQQLGFAVENEEDGGPGMVRVNMSKKV